MITPERLPLPEYNTVIWPPEMIDKSECIGTIEATDITGYDPYRVDTTPKELIGDLFGRVKKERQNTLENQKISAIWIEPGSPYADIARNIEAREFKNAWYKDMSNEEFAQDMREEYGPYERSSKFIVLLDNENIDKNGLPGLMGMARLCGGNEDLLKTVNDMPDVWGCTKEAILADLKDSGDTIHKSRGAGLPELTVDFSSLTVTEAYRHTEAYAVLSHEVHAEAKRAGMSTITTIMVENLWQIYKTHGVPFEPILNAEPAMHMGEMSLPVRMHLIDVERYMKTSKDPKIIQAYKYLHEAEGLEFSKHRL